MAAKEEKADVRLQISGPESWPKSWGKVGVCKCWIRPKLFVHLHYAGILTTKYHSN